MAIFFLECSPPALSAPKRLFFRFARNGKQGRCAHTCYFCVAVAPQKCLLGSSPNPPDFWTLCPEVLVVCGPGATAPGPYFSVGFQLHYNYNKKERPSCESTSRTMASTYSFSFSTSVRSGNAAASSITSVISCFNSLAF